jgi:hypothetical protein
MPLKLQPNGNVPSKSWLTVPLLAELGSLATGNANWQASGSFRGKERLVARKGSVVYRMPNVSFLLYFPLCFLLSIASCKSSARDPKMSL